MIIKNHEIKFHFDKSKSIFKFQSTIASSSFNIHNSFSIKSIIMIRRNKSHLQISCLNES